MNSNLFDAIASGLKLRGGRPVIKFSDQIFTGDEVINIIGKLQVLFSSHGVKAGDQVLLINNGDIYFPLFFNAITSLSAIVVPCPTGANIRVGESYLREVVEPSYVITLTGSASSKTVKILDTPYSLEKPERSSDRHSAVLKELNIASIMFTSGTTGVPKGVLVSHQNLLTTIEKNIQFQRLSEDTVELNTLPLTHSFGLGQLNATIAAGGFSKVLPGLANIGRVFNENIKKDVSSLPLTPLGLKILTGRYLEVFSDYFCGLRTIMVNSAPLPPEISKKILEIFPDVRLLVYYGLTEASRSTLAELDRNDETSLMSVGKPLGDTEIKLTAEGSEIVVSGSNVSPGYFYGSKNPIEFHNDKGLFTGDKGCFDSEGRLVIIGRMFDEINIGGYKVDPLEIERISEELTEVDVACLTVDDSNEEFLETVLLVQSDVSISENSVISFLRKKLEHFKVPNKVITVEKIPVHDNGKLDRKEAKRLTQR